MGTKKKPGRETNPKPAKVAGPPRKATPAAEAAVDEVAPPPADPPTDARGAYEALVPAANALAADVPTYRVDTAVAPTNVAKTVKYLRSRWDDIPAHLPRVDRAALASLPSAMLAVTFAELEAERTTPSEKVVSQKLARARALRKKLLPVLQGLAANGLVPETEVSDIVKGKGPKDLANDCVAIAECFRRHAAKIAGKHAATDADLAEAAEVGAFLQGTLKTARSKHEKAPAPSDAVKMRNRMGAVLQARQDLARRVAYYFEGAAFEDFVPALNAHEATPRPADDTPAAPPPPAAPPGDEATQSKPARKG